jgi:hypothetical protein
VEKYRIDPQVGLYYVTFSVVEKYRIDPKVGLYYVTFSVVDWLPVFIDQAACKILVDSLEFCVRHKHLGVNAYVFMPTHLHAIVFDRQFDQARLKHTLDDLRKFTGRQLLDHSAGHLPECISEVFLRKAGRTGSAAFGGQPSIRWGSILRGSGSRNSIICIGIPAARGWCSGRRIGGFRPPCIGAGGKPVM